MSLLVHVTPEAETQIRDIDSWWRENRLAVPDLFLSELTESFDLIAGAPQIGACTDRRLSEMRDVCYLNGRAITSTT